MRVPTRIDVLLILLLVVVAVNSLKFSGEKRMQVDKMQKYFHRYFPQENSLCVVLAETEEDEFLPVLNVPVVVYTQDQILQDCTGTSTDQGGYVLMTSNIVNLEKQIIPLLNCLNKTNLKLKSKYILVLDVSKNVIPTYEDIYSNFFHNLWNSFGIINIAILPVKTQNVDTKQPIIFVYNPFLAHNNRPSAFIKRNLTQDIRDFMIGRLRNMNSQHLRAVMFRIQKSKVTLKDLYEKQPLGADPGTLFKQTLEERLNVKFDLYESSKRDNKGLMNLEEEIMSGRAEYCINTLFIHPDEDLLTRIQVISTGFSMRLVFVVPKPKYLESWQYFQYIFQWQVCVGLGIVLLLLCGAALLFHHVLSTTVNHNISGLSQVMSVWKATLSISINKLPTTHSQRLLVVLSLLLGLIFLTLFSAQLFGLIKSKPRLSPIRNLQDLRDSNLPIYTIYKEFAVYMNVFENTSLHKLKDNLKTDRMYENANYMNPKYLNITERALVYTDVMVQLVESLPQNKEVLQYFDVLKEPIYQAIMVTYIPIDSIYHDHFNNLNLRTVSAGLHLKWLDAYTRQAVKHYSSSSTSSPSAPQGSPRPEDHVPLTYDDVKMAFYTFYIGLMVSTLCFLKEVCKVKPFQWLTSRS